MFADSNLPNRPTYGEFKRVRIANPSPTTTHFPQVLLNIGFVAVDGDDYAVRPGEELARTNDTLFRYNPVCSTPFSTFLPRSHPHTDATPVRRTSSLSTTSSQSTHTARTSHPRPPFPNIADTSSVAGPLP